jgi:uncharacterized membrane protein
MYVATPPLSKLTDTFNNIASRFVTDLLNPQQRLGTGWTVLSPTSQTMSLNGLIHKILVYISEFFVAVGAIILAIKPKEFKLHLEFRWLAMCAAFLLLVCVAVPNVAPTLNFGRFYRYSMVFLAPLFILGGVYFLGLFRKILPPSFTRTRFVIRDFRLLMLATILVAFFLFRSGFVNTVTGDRSYSYSLDFDRMRTSNILEVRMGVYSIFVPEQDLFGARWLALQIGNNSVVYAENYLGIATLIDYTTLDRQNIRDLLNETQYKPESFIYLRSFNVLGGLIAFAPNYFNLSDLSPPLSLNSIIYSNGATEVNIVP